MALIAIEFDDQNLLVTAARSGSMRPCITHAVQLPYAEKSDDEAGQALKKLLQAMGVFKCEGIAIVSRSVTEIRELQVPPAPEDELPDMIRFQARSEFASLDDDWALDYVPLSMTEGNPTQVLAAALTPQLDTSIKTICRVANVKLKRILLRPFAAADLLKSHFADGELGLLVDQNTDTTDLSLIDGKKLISTRTVRLPANMSPDKRSKQLISEVRRTLAAARTASQGRKVKRVVISGKAEKNRLLAGDLAGPLGMEVEFMDPFSKVEVEDGAVINAIELPGRYMSSLGGLQMELADTRPDIDFLNPRRPVVKKVDYRKYQYYAALAAAIAFIAMVFGWRTLGAQKQEIADLRATLVEKIRINEGDERMPSVDQRLAEVGKIDAWKTDEVNWLVELSEFSNRYLLPDDVVADSFIASFRPGSRGRISLNGRIVEDLAKTAALLESLEQRPYSVETMDTGVDKSDRDSKLTSTFEYQIKLVDPPAGEDQPSPMLQLDRAALAFLRKQKEAAEGN